MPGKLSYEGPDEIKLLITGCSEPSINEIINKVNEIATKVNILIDLQNTRINRRQ